MEELSISDLIDLIAKNPSLLRRPIIMDKKRMQIGFNEDEIRAFYQEITVNRNYVERL